MRFGFFTIEAESNVNTVIELQSHSGGSGERNTLVCGAEKDIELYTRLDDALSIAFSNLGNLAPVLKSPALKKYGLKRPDLSV